MLSRSQVVWLLSVIVFVIGFVIATATPGPLLTVDDSAYLALGRTIAGKGSAPMGPQAPYGVLYPAMLAPGWLVGLSESSILVYARAINALAGAALVPVLDAVIRRLWPDHGARALPAAVVGAMLPAALLTASIVWTERLLALLVAAAVLALARQRDESLGRADLLAATIGVALFATHPRMGPAAVVVIGAAAGMVWRGSRARAAGLLVFGGLGLLLVERLRGDLAEAAFGSSGTYDAGDLASRRGLSELTDMIQHGIGTLTYLTLAGTGIAIVGLTVLARHRATGRQALAILGAIVAIAAWFLTGVPRADKWLHGRYIEVMAPLIVAVGVVHLREVTKRQAIVVLAAIPATSGIVAAGLGPGNNWLHPRSPVMMLGVEVSGAPFGGNSFEPGAAAAAAIVVAGLAWMLSRRAWQWAVPLWLIGVSLVGVWSGLETLDQLYDGAPSGQVNAALSAIDPVGEVYIDIGVVSPNIANAVIWEVGFDHAAIDFDKSTTHVLIPAEAAGPPESVLVAELGAANLWQLP